MSRLRETAGRLRRLLPLAVLVVAPACAYFNGVYNAREAQRNADKRMRAGRDSEAAPYFAAMAEKAETVLVRYPKSKWRTEALYLAGRGHAYAGRCPQALVRLDEFLSIGGTEPEKRARASLAMGTCLVKQERYSEALHLLDSLATARDEGVSDDAALWAARAAIALGDNDVAQRYLANVDAGAAQWELATASLQRGEYARAESLLALRAAEGDWQDGVPERLTALWVAGRTDAVSEIVRRYDEARTPSSAKARLHLLAGTLQMGAYEPERDSIAAAHFTTAMRLSMDTAIDRESAARLTMVMLRGVRSPADVDGILRRGREDARGHRLQQRLEDNALLMRILTSTSDGSGSAAFLGAEVARDSLEAPLLARELFRRVAATHPQSLMAPRALIAAAQLWPDSAEAFYDRVREQYSASPYAVLLNGGDPGSMPAYRQADILLRESWTNAVRVLVDSVRALRPPPSQASSQQPAGAAVP